MHRKRPKYMISFRREEVWLSTWLGVGDGKHVGVLHCKVLGELQALRAVRLRRQGNTSVVNVLTGAHGGRLQVPPGDLCSWVAVPALLYFTQRAASPRWPSNTRKSEPPSEVGTFSRASQLRSPSHPSYSPRQSHDPVNVTATFLSVQTSYSFQRPPCTYRKWCVHVLGTRPAHCVASIMGRFVKFQRPQLRERRQRRSRHGEGGVQSGIP